MFVCTLHSETGNKKIIFQQTRYFYFWTHRQTEGPTETTSVRITAFKTLCLLTQNNKCVHFYGPQFILRKTFEMFIASENFLGKKKNINNTKNGFCLFLIRRLVEIYK